MSWIKLCPLPSVFSLMSPQETPRPLYELNFCERRCEISMVLYFERGHRYREYRIGKIVSIRVTWLLQHLRMS